MERNHEIENVQPGATEGLVARVIQELMRYIRKNHLSPGDRLPTQSTLAEQLNVSLASLREALASMQTAGVIRQVHGVGTFLASDPRQLRTWIETNWSISEMIRAEGMEPGTREMTVTREAPPSYIALPLGLTDEQPLHCLRRVRTADDVPIAYTVNFLAPVLEHVDLSRLRPADSLYQFLESEYGVHLQRTDALIEVATALDLTSEKLGIPCCAPLLKMTQLHYDDQGRLVVASVELFI